MGYAPLQRKPAASELGKATSVNSSARRSPDSTIPARSTRAELFISSPRDLGEKEADAVATEVVDGVELEGRVAARGVWAGRQPIPRAAEPSLQAGTAALGSFVIPSRGLDRTTSSDLLQGIFRARENEGRPLSTNIRNKLEPRFGADLGQTRIHTGAGAAALAQQLAARAFTVGNDVFFAQGEYRPEHRPGMWLLAHELAHVTRPAPRGLVQRSPTTATVPPVDRAFKGPTDMQEALVMEAVQNAATTVAAAIRRLQAISKEPGAADPAILYFLGDLDGARMQRLFAILNGIETNLRTLQDNPEGFVFEPSDKNIAFHPDEHEEPSQVQGKDAGRYTLTNKLFPASAPGSSTGSNPLVMLALIHEAAHEYLYYETRKTKTDFSNSHGVVPLLPSLAGIDPLDNAESIASVAVALGMDGTFDVLRKDAEGSKDAVGLSPSERRLALAVFRYASSVIVHTWGSNYPPIGAQPVLLRQAVLAAQNAPGTILAPSFEQHELQGFATDAMVLYRGIRAVLVAGEAEFADVARLVAAGAARPEPASPENLVLRGPVLRAIQVNAAVLDLPRGKLSVATFEELTALVLAELYDRHYRASPHKSKWILDSRGFWLAFSRTMIAQLPGTSHADLRDAVRENAS